jgi:serine/threonine-protein kinase
LWDGEGQTDKAIEDYTRLLQLELDPQERVWVLNNRGWAYAQQGDFSAAIRDYDQAITLCTADASDRGKKLIPRASRDCLARVK